MDEEIDKILIVLHFRNSAMIFTIIFMRVEVEFITLNNKLENDKVKQACSISPGNCESIQFLGKNPKIIAFCNVDNKKGTVLIKGWRKTVEIVKYRNIADNVGRVIRVRSKIKISGSEQLSIIRKNKFRQQVIIFLSSGQDQEPNLQESSDEIPSDPPLTAA